MLGSWHHSMLIERTVSLLQAQTAKTMFKAFAPINFQRSGENGSESWSLSDMERVSWFKLTVLCLS